MPTRPPGPCSHPGCPNRGTHAGRCPAHKAQHSKAADQARGTAWQRGYDTGHRAERRRMARLVDSGMTGCAKCGRLIVPGTAWDLGHTPDRTGWTGPEHAACNRSDGGRSASHPARR